MKYSIATILLLISVSVFADDSAWKEHRQNEITCLAMNMYHEARSEGTKGKLAVGFVTMNRVNSERFPNTVCEVVWQKRQFSWTHDGKRDYPYERKAWRKAVKMARYIFDNYDDHWVRTKGAIDITNGALYYYAHKLVEPYWSRYMVVSNIIGGHTFGIVRQRG